MAEPNVWTKNSTESDDGELLPWRGDPAELNSMGTPTGPTVTTVSASGMMSPIVNQKRPRGGAGAIPSVSFQAQMASAIVCHQATPAAIE